MGIRKMLKFLNINYPHIIKKINTNNFNKTKIAVDISILLYQVVIAIRNSGADMMNNQGEITSHILGLFNKTIGFLKMNIIPVYVFDGKPPEFKLKILNNRKEIKQKAYDKLNEDLTDEEKIKYFKRTVSISKKQYDECMELLDIMGIPYIQAIEEADSQCAELVKSGIVDGVLTEDMDIMTFGGNKIYRNILSYEKEKISVELNDILKELKLTYEQFVELCILFGCDYCDKIKDIEPEDVYKYYMNNMNIPDTLKEIKNNNIRIPDIPLDEYLYIKKYFMNPPVIKVSGLEMKKCDSVKLEKLLVSKYGLVKMKIQQKLQFIENY